LENFKRNPIILFNHNYDKPIGRATGLKTGSDGLELEAKISKAAPDAVAQLVKDGVLGAFSVGFRVKDADYIKETDGLLIKDAELFEVSVVSVPCNQAATFSLAKSFNSMEEYDEFKKTFTNRVDLAGQSLAKDEVNTSSVASETPEKPAPEAIIKETKMSDQIDLEAFAKKVAEETAATIAMKQAEQKAAAEKAAKEEAEAEKAAEAVRVEVQNGAEKLQADIEAKLAEKDAKFDAIVAEFKKELEEKTDELTKIRESKRVFADRGEGKTELSKWGKDFMYGHMLGVMTGKGWDTKFGSGLLNKAGIDYASNAGDIDQEVSMMIEKEITLELKTAQLFREIRVNGAATVLPIQPDVEPATFQTGAATSGNLENRGASDNTYKVQQVILNAYRLISQTYMDNHIDEEVLVNLMPMLVESVARAHARAVDNAIINGSGSITGLDGYATASGTTLSIAGGDPLTAAGLLALRQGMGKYGVNPGDLAFIVSLNRYYELIEDAGFADITDVGSNVATKITGSVGAVYGTPVIVSDSFAAEGAGVPVAFAVNLKNFAIPRLRGVTVERDYEVGNQRNVIVATQSLGFEELVADAAGSYSSMKIDLAV
jgi:HK97 family phage prohead protease